MPALITHHLVPVIALSIQILVFVYLYTSYRERFFRYLIYAWGFFVVHKSASFVLHLVPQTPAVLLLGSAAGMLGDGVILAAASALRWQYRLRWWHMVLAVLTAMTAVVLTEPSLSVTGIPSPSLMSSGAVLIAAGVVFWPQTTAPTSPGGARFLALGLVLWGLHRLAAGYLQPPPESGLALGVNAAFYLCYFLVVLAITILVLDAARRHTAMLKEFNERLVDGLGEGLQLVDGTFRIRHANRWMTQHSGSASRQRCYDALTQDGQPCPGCPLAQRHQIEMPVHLDVMGPGERRLRLTCAPVHQPDGQILLLELVADVTEQERLRTRLSEAERLAAVGELAAGLAHEIRNPLAAIVNATTLLEQPETLTAEERTTTLTAMKQEARRLNAVLSDFLAFARPREPRRQQGNIGEVVGHVATLLREDRAGATRVQVQVHLDPTVPAFAFDPDQLTQVLWNLARNGVEAMQGHGRLSLDVQRQAPPGSLDRRCRHRRRYSCGRAVPDLSAVLLQAPWWYRAWPGHRQDDCHRPWGAHRPGIGPGARQPFYHPPTPRRGERTWPPFSSLMTSLPRARRWPCS